MNMLCSGKMTDREKEAFIGGNARSAYEKKAESEEKA